MEIKKSTLQVVIVLLLVIGAGYFLIKDSSVTPNGNIVATGEFQEVVVGMKDYNYYPNKLAIIIDA